MFGSLSEEIRSKYLVVSPSSLIEFKKSPLHYYWKYVLKNKETSKAMELGTLLHMAILEPNSFEEKYVCLDEVPEHTVEELKLVCDDLGIKPSSKDKKAQIIELIQMFDPGFTTLSQEKERAVNAGKTVVSRIESNAVTCAIENIKKTKVSSKFLANAKKEQKGYVKFSDEVYISFQVDAWDEYKDGLGILCDIKTSKSIKSDYVRRWNYDSGRHIQMAMYCDALKAITGLSFDDLSYFLFLEPFPPCPVAEYSVTQGMLDAGRSEYRVLIKQILECHNKNQWPGPQAEIEATDLSDWDYQRVLLDEENFGI